MIFGVEFGFQNRLPGVVNETDFKSAPFVALSVRSYDVDALFEHGVCGWFVR